MEALRQLISASAAGQKLLAALERSSSDLPSLIAAVLQERLHDGNAAANGVPARVSLDGAASVVSGLTFLTPRCAKHARVTRPNAFVWDPPKT